MAGVTSDLDCDGEPGGQLQYCRGPEVGMMGGRPIQGMAGAEISTTVTQPGKKNIGMACLSLFFSSEKKKVFPVKA